MARDQKFNRQPYEQNKKRPLKTAHRRLPPTRSIFVDVDGTLVSSAGIINTKIVRYCQSKKVDGFDIVLWSARGRSHAMNTALGGGIVGLFTAIIGKPGYIFDDIGWEWARDVVILKYEDIKDF